MADSGYNWDAAWSFVQDSDPSDWNADALADAATEISGTALDMDGKAACDISIAAYEDNTGAIDDVVHVYVLGDIDGTNYQDTSDDGAYSFTFTPVQNDTVYKRFRLLGSDWTKFKIAIFNDSGQEIAFSVRYKMATIPPAS
jgi:hypothetical protein